MEPTFAMATRRFIWALRSAELALRLLPSRTITFGSRTTASGSVWHRWIYEYINADMYTKFVAQSWLDPDLSFIKWISPWRTRPKSLNYYNTFRVLILKNKNHRLELEIVYSDWRFWVSRWGFVMLAKPIGQIQRKSNFVPPHGILCTRSRLIFLVWIWKRFWLEQVCKVCAQSALLLRIYIDSWCEAVLTPSSFGPSGVEFVFFYGSFIKLLLLFGRPNRNIAGTL